MQQNTDEEESEILIDVEEVRQEEFSESINSEASTSQQSVKRKSVTPPPVGIKRQSASRVDEAYKIMKQLVKNRKEKDASATFAEYIASHHRLYSPQTKNVVERLVTNIIFQADMGYYDKEINPSTHNHNFAPTSHFEHHPINHSSFLQTKTKPNYAQYTQNQLPTSIALASSFSSYNNQSPSTSFHNMPTKFATTSPEQLHYPYATSTPIGSSSSSNDQSPLNSFNIISTKFANTPSQYTHDPQFIPTLSSPPSSRDQSPLISSNDIVTPPFLIMSQNNNCSHPISNLSYNSSISLNTNSVQPSVLSSYTQNPYHHINIPATPSPRNLSPQEESPSSIV